MLKNLIILLLIILTNTVLANEQVEIIKNIQKINSLHFSFKQINNNVIETGYCNILYPNKVHCIYDDNYQKEIFIIDNNLSILEKEGKKSSYDINNTPFMILLNKEDLINVVKKTEKLYVDEKYIIIKSDNNQDNAIEIYFDKKTFLISGWKIQNYDKTNLQFILDKVKINIDNIDKFIMLN
jgi:outer membrane lipoprotein-sorting protein